ncbi:MAG TPA: hypothetical protein VFR97_10245, partial [Capillimicrobium sp.]|nr:hypothetical protein [Capillimicrobium sp.]
MDGMYDVGGIEAHLGATFDDRKFNEWERELDKAEARARRERIEAQLGAKLDDSAFAAFERHLDKAEARAKRRDAFKAALGVDYDAKASQALRAYERDLDRAEHEQQRLARSAVSMHRDVGNARGFMAASSAVSALNRNVAGLRNTVSLLKWPAAITGVGLFAQTLSTAAAGATALVSGLAPLGGLLAALPAAASAGLQSVGAVGLATLGVTDAITAAFEDQKTSSSGVTSALERQESATESIRDAELRLADAQRQTRYAEQERTAAVREARQELLDLRAAVEGNALSEEQAALALRQARQEYARVASDPGSSMLDIEQAELGVRQARFDLDQATREAARTERDFAEARERGVRRMPQVVAATRALRDARRAEREAALDVRRAYDDAGDAADNLAAKSAASASKAEQALQKLPPAARAFAREIIDLKPRIDALRADTAEGFFPGAEQGLHRSLGLLDVLERRLPRTAGVIGGLVAQAGAWAGSRDVLADVETQMRRNDRWVRQLGEGTLDLADATRNVTLEAGPLVGWLVKSTREIAALVQQESEAARETGELKAIFRETREVTSDVAHIAWDIAAGLWEIGKAGKPLGDEILDDLRDGAAEFREWTESAEGRNELKEYFDDARPAVRELGRLTEEAVKMFFRLGRGDQVAPLLEKIRTELLPVVEEVVDNTTEAFGPALIDTLVEVLELFGTMVSEGGPLVEAVELVGAIAGKINDLIDRFPALGDAVGTIVALGGLAKALQIAGAITGMTRLIGLMRTARGIAATTGAMEVAAGAGAARAGAGAAAGAAAGRGAML